jgi:hypothetical protein
LNIKQLCGCLIALRAAAHCPLREQPTHSPAGLLGVVGFAAASTLLTDTVVDVVLPAGIAGMSGFVSAGVASLARTQAHSARQATARSSDVFIVDDLAAFLMRRTLLVRELQKRTAVTIPLPLVRLYQPSNASISLIQTTIYNRIGARSPYVLIERSFTGVSASRCLGPLVTFLPLMASKSPILQ